MPCALGWKLVYFKYMKKKDLAKTTEPLKGGWLGSALYAEQTLYRSVVCWTRRVFASPEDVLPHAGLGSTAAV